MVHDQLEDPQDPLSEPFQHRMLERGKRLEALRPVIPMDADAAAEFRALAAEQLQAYEQLLQASHRFPRGNVDSPAEVFGAPWLVRSRNSVTMRTPPNKRLKLAARVDYGMDSSSARRSLSAIR